MSVNTNVIKDSGSLYVVQLQSINDGSDESAVVKVDKSGLLIGDAEPTTLSLQRIVWATQGFTYIMLEWSHTANALMYLIPGTGFGDESFSEYGGSPDGETGGTGDVILTTVGGSSGDTYDILLELVKVA